MYYVTYFLVLWISFSTTKYDAGIGINHEGFYQFIRLNQEQLREMQRTPLSNRNRTCATEQPRSNMRPCATEIEHAPLCYRD